MELLVSEFHGSKLYFFVISPVHRLWSSSPLLVRDSLFVQYSSFVLLLIFFPFNTWTLIQQAKYQVTKEQAGCLLFICTCLTSSPQAEPLSFCCRLRSRVVCVPTGQQIGHICCYSRQAHGGQVPCSDKPDTSLKGCRKHQRLQLSSCLLYWSIDFSGRSILIYQSSFEHSHPFKSNCSLHVTIMFSLMKVQYSLVIP